MRSKQEIFLDLTRFWYDFVSQEHHKDRDCHFYINKVYSYGKRPHWRIEHYGYNVQLPISLENKKFNTHDEAFEKLYSWLASQVRNEIATYKDYAEDETDFNWQGLKKVANQYKYLLDEI